jgi:hypothetical protein
MLAGVSSSAPQQPETRQLTEKEQREAALAARLEKRATFICGCITRFLTRWRAARTAMLLADKAAREAAALKKGKKGVKKKKAKEKAPEAKKDGKKAKPTLNPIQDAWSKFEAELDERINKAKNCGLGDIYPAVAKLSGLEQHELACIINASNNKKILPIEGLNPSILNIRITLFASAAAFDVGFDKASICHRLSDKVDKGASETAILEAGFTLSDLERVGRPIDTPGLLSSSFAQSVTIT